MLTVTGDSNNEVTKSNTHRVTNSKVLLSVTITKLLMLLTLILLPSQEH